MRCPPASIRCMVRCTSVTVTSWPATLATESAQVLVVPPIGPGTMVTTMANPIRPINTPKSQRMAVCFFWKNWNITVLLPHLRQTLNYSEPRPRAHRNSPQARQTGPQVTTAAGNGDQNASVSAAALLNPLSRYAIDSKLGLCLLMDQKQPEDKKHKIAPVQIYWTTVTY